MIINLSAVHALSQVDGTPIQEILDLYDTKTTGRKFGSHGASSQCLDYKFISTSCPTLWLDRVAIEPRLAEFFIEDTDLPTFLATGCENMTPAEVEAVVNLLGDLGVAWSPVVEGV